MPNNRHFDRTMKRTNLSKTAKVRKQPRRAKTADDFIAAKFGVRFDHASKSYVKVTS